VPYKPRMPSRAHHPCSPALAHARPTFAHLRPTRTQDANEESAAAEQQRQRRVRVMDAAEARARAAEGRANEGAADVARLTTQLKEAQQLAASERARADAAHEALVAERTGVGISMSFSDEGRRSSRTPLSFGGVGSSWSEEESADGGGAQAQAEVALQSEVDAARLRLESEQRALEERRARREADKQAAAATPERGRTAASAANGTPLRMACEWPGPRLQHCEWRANGDARAWPYGGQRCEWHATANGVRMAWTTSTALRMACERRRPSVAVRRPALRMARHCEWRANGVRRVQAQAASGGGEVQAASSAPRVVELRLSTRPDVLDSTCSTAAAAAAGRAGGRAASGLPPTSWEGRPRPRGRLRPPRGRTWVRFSRGAGAGRDGRLALHVRRRHAASGSTFDALPGWFVLALALCARGGHRSGARALYIDIVCVRVRFLRRQGSGWAWYGIG